VVIHYFIGPVNSFSEDAPRISFENDIANFLLRNDILYATIKDDQMEEADARMLVEQYLDDWNLEVEIIGRWTGITFTYLESPLTNTVGGRSATESPIETTVIPEASELVIQYSQYPTPPICKVTPAMRLIWERFKWARLGLREPLQSAAYFAFTVIRQSAENEQASKIYNVDAKILRKLSELSTIRGDSRTARKALVSDARPLTRSEKYWVDMAIRSILLQIGQIAAGLSPDRITWSSLPSID
jgi:hypothetical protein